MIKQWTEDKFEQFRQLVCELFNTEPSCVKCKQTEEEIKNCYETLDNELKATKDLETLKS